MIIFFNSPGEFKSVNTSEKFYYLIYIISNIINLIGTISMYFSSQFFKSNFRLGEHRSETLILKWNWKCQSEWRCALIQRMNCSLQYTKLIWPFLFLYSIQTLNKFVKFKYVSYRVWECKWVGRVRWSVVCLYPKN